MKRNYQFNDSKTMFDETLPPVDTKTMHDVDKNLFTMVGFFQDCVKLLRTEFKHEFEFIAS